jgi:hypothetical protein
LELRLACEHLAPLSVMTRLVLAAFCNFIDTYPRQDGFLLQLISFLPPLHVYMLEYSESGFYESLVIACGPR